MKNNNVKRLYSLSGQKFVALGSGVLPLLVLRTLSLPLEKSVQRRWSSRLVVLQAVAVEKPAPGMGGCPPALPRRGGFVFVPLRESHPSAVHDSRIAWPVPRTAPFGRDTAFLWRNFTSLAAYRCGRSICQR